jgi:hypothetical protein
MQTIFHHEAHEDHEEHEGCERLVFPSSEIVKQTAIETSSAWRIQALLIPQSLQQRAGQ